MRSLNRQGMWKLGFCVSWSIITATALMVATLITSAFLSQQTYVAWYDQGYFLFVMPLVLSIFEFPIAFYCFYWLTKNWSVSLAKSLLWGIAVTTGALWLALPLLYLISGFLGFLLSEALIGFLQGLLLKPFVCKSPIWVLVRGTAFLGGPLLPWLILDYPSPIAIELPSPGQAIVMGAFGGLIKGIGLLWLIEHPKKVRWVEPG